MTYLNGLQVKAADIMNTYATGPITEIIWTVLGLEFGADAEKKAIIVFVFKSGHRE